MVCILPPLQLGVRIKNFRKAFAEGGGRGGGDQKLLFWWGSYIVVEGGGLILLLGSCNFEVKIKIA